MIIEDMGLFHKFALIRAVTSYWNNWKKIAKRKMVEKNERIVADGDYNLVKNETRVLFSRDRV